MKYTFPKNFKFGATGAGWQMDGETDKRPEQMSYPHLMWESDKENWHLGIGPDVASDFYGHFREDIPLFYKAGIRQYRFNIDWSRFLDDYENVVVNEKAAQFYSECIDLMIANGIEPVLRLIKLASDGIHAAGGDKWIGICGEMAADEELTELLISSGIDELSVSPPYIARVKEKVRGIE